MGLGAVVLSHLSLLWTLEPRAVVHSCWAGGLPPPLRLLLEILGSRSPFCIIHQPTRILFMVQMFTETSHGW